MIITKRLTSCCRHVSKEVFLRQKEKPKMDQLSNVKIFYYGDINFIAQVGICQLVYYYGIEFNRILN